MANKYYKHITKGPERWDSIAYIYYGDPLKYTPIVEANPQLKIEPILKQGTVVYVPIIEETRETVIEVLPPWKQ